MFVVVKVQIALALGFAAAEQPVGRGELGHDEPASTEVFDEAAEDSVRHPGHRGENRGGRNPHIADQDGIRHAHLLWRLFARPSRNVPVLPHVLILPLSS